MIRTNYELMQLKDVNISGSSKMKIIQMFEGAINPFVKDDFFRMLIDDRMAEAIKNVKMWCMDVFDGKGVSHRRRQIYSEYKNNRKPGSDIKRSPYLQTDEDPKASMVRQMRRLSEYLETLPVTTMVIDHIEADDTIAYLTTLVRERGGQSYIMSTDLDFLQLVNDDVAVWSPTKKKLYFKNDVVEEYGVSANNFLLYRTITGDKGDNLPLS